VRIETQEKISISKIIFLAHQEFGNLNRF